MAASRPWRQSISLIVMIFGLGFAAQYVRGDGLFGSDGLFASDGFAVTARTSFSRWLQERRPSIIAEPAEATARPFLHHEPADGLNPPGPSAADFRRACRPMCP